MQVKSENIKKSSV